MKSILFSILLSVPMLLTAQQKVGHLTIFSEDGDKFFVVLNGEKQNTVAQTNIRIEDLPQPYYSAKIIFEDASILPITQKNLQLTDFNGTMMDVTYRIKKDKNGKVKLQPYSSIDVTPDFVPSASTKVYRYGDPEERTTTTTTTGGANASINVNGMSMTIKVDDDAPVTNTTRTTTTRTTTTRTTTTGGYDEAPPVRTSSTTCYAMRSSDFNAAKQTVSNASFEESKLSTAKSIISANCLSSDQVVEICKLFSFEQTKLDFAKLAYKKTTDKSNYFKVNNVFDFDASKDELSSFISNQ